MNLWVGDVAAHDYSSEPARFDTDATAAFQFNLGYSTGPCRKGYGVRRSLGGLFEVSEMARIL